MPFLVYEHSTVWGSPLLKQQRPETIELEQVKVAIRKVEKENYQDKISTKFDVSEFY